MKSRFEEFIEIDKFRKVLNYVSRATGLAFAMLDPLGNIIIPPMNESEFCVAARKDPNVASKCVDCIIHSAIAAAKSKKTNFFKCQYGILEFVVPIFINGEYVSAICGGEVRTDIDDVVDYVYPYQDFDPALQKYYDEFRVVEKDRYFAATKLIEMIVNNLSNLDLVMKIAKNNVDSERVDSRVRVAVKFINENYASKITLAQLAEMSYVSENYFSKLFMRAMKQNVTDYITSCRIEKAKEFLLQTDIKIGKIAEMVGVEDPAYFHRMFKKYTGMTPNNFRSAVF